VTEERDVEARLVRGVFGDEASDHLDDGVIAAWIERSEPLSDRAKLHLASCLECREIIGALLRERSKVVELPRRRWLAGVAIAASIALVSLLMIPDEYRGTKGRTAELSRGVALLAIDARGARRDLEDGSVVRTTDRIGFIAGHPGESEATLTILGWDGKQVHWYYPEKAGDPPHRIASGTIGERLPFDVELSDHAPGALLVAAGFDVDPRALAGMLERGKLEGDLFLFRLTLEAK
jgi:hypothetical protein